MSSVLRFFCWFYCIYVTQERPFSYPPHLISGHTCHHKRCSPISPQVWLQKWPKPGFLLPYLQKTALKKPFYAGMAILKNLCAEEGGGSGVGDADFEEIARTVGAFVEYNGAVLLGAAVELLA